MKRPNFYRLELLSLDRQHAESVDTIHAALVSGSNRIRLALELHHASKREASILSARQTNRSFKAE